MSLSDPFSDVQVAAIGRLPHGVCDGLIILTDGNVAYTTQKGTVISAYAVVAGQIIPVRIQTIGAGTTASVLAGYHL